MVLSDSVTAISVTFVPLRKPILRGGNTYKLPKQKQERRADISVCFPPFACLVTLSGKQLRPIAGIIPICRCSVKIYSSLLCLVISEQCYRESYLPMRNILVPHTGQMPWVAGLPFFMVMLLALFISLLARHFTQYACICVPPSF